MKFTSRNRRISTDVISFSILYKLAFIFLPKGNKSSYSGNRYSCIWPLNSTTQRGSSTKSIVVNLARVIPTVQIFIVVGKSGEDIDLNFVLV